jgi:hypothetical protein
MDIKEKREVLIAEIEQFKEAALKTHIVKVWADSYTNTNPFGYIFIEDNKVWWMKTQAHQLWQMWQASKVAVIPEGFVLVPKEPTDEMIKAGYEYCEPNGILLHSFYTAMLKACEGENHG